MVLSGPEKEETRAAAAYLSATTGRALLGFDLEYEALCSFAWWANRVHPPYNSKRPSSVGVEVLEISRAGGGGGLLGRTPLKWSGDACTPYTRRGNSRNNP
jgi:hypothetical protein